jgi:hypothetical protein
LTHNDAVSLHTELTRLAAQYPGADEQGKALLQRILFSFSIDPDCGGYLSEKVTTVGSYLEAWLSSRKWQKWGDDPASLKILIDQSLYKLKRAIDQQFVMDDHASS